MNAFRILALLHRPLFGALSKDAMTSQRTQFSAKVLFPFNLYFYSRAALTMQSQRQ